MQLVFSWAPKLARKCESKHRFPCGSDGRTVVRSVYGHVVTKFSGMGRFPFLRYNLRAHAVQFSKRKGREKRNRSTYCKMNLTKQSKRSNVILPIKMQAILIRRKKDWNIFMKRNFKVSSFAHGRDGANTVNRVRNIFSIWRKGTMSKNKCEN